MNNTVNDPLPQWEEPEVNRVTLRYPWRWLAKGWQGIRAAPGYSLRYGVLIVLISLLVILLTRVAHLTFLVPFLTSGFFLLAPILAIGLYRMSSHLEHGEPLKNCRVIEAIRSNQAQFGDRDWIPYYNYAVVDTDLGFSFYHAV